MTVTKEKKLNSNSSIEVKNLTKRYRLGTIGMTSLREDISRWWHSKKKSGDTENSDQKTNLDRERVNANREFLALNDVSFSVKKGEVIGIIGANGSGKSTLLKILSRITEPSSGKACIRGKVASLLEVGTGFHPELTGKDNIYINGAILGMSRKEVDRKFDEIVNFSGVADFLDTPIKRYSTGMTIRLGFAVAAHLEPDILIVDEVLAVGDAAFQKKCIGKMKDVADSGRTVLFVSHNMNSISSLCSRGILLNKGFVRKDDNVNNVIDEYLSDLTTYGSKVVFPESDRPTRDNIASLHSLKVINRKNDNVSYSECSESIGIEIVYEIIKETSEPTAIIDVSTSKDELLFTTIADSDNRPFKKGIHTVILWIPENIFNQGKYFFSISLVNTKNWQIHSYLKNSLAIELYENLEKRKCDFEDKLWGVVKPNCTWEYKSN